MHALTKKQDFACSHEQKCSVVYDIKALCHAMDVHKNEQK